MKEKSMKTMYGGLFIFIGIIIMLVSLFGNFMSTAPAKPLNWVSILISIGFMVLGTYMFRDEPSSDDQ
ncbi:hypothetical protein ACFODZ_03015 [Marinicella sediminis]|uniref:DUF3098 domain-containing protein n=1 Tax=Marinicella sediminis TaxID=1792834 RepID=A0ABV7JAU9_9GAMM|nr:hypothetical protein [Marinicella sediminis]